MKMIDMFWLLVCAIPGFAQEPLTVGEKLRIHFWRSVGVGSFAETAVYAAALHGIDLPREWGQSAEAYGWRVASAAGATAIRNVFAFTLDAPLREDPRYERSGPGGAWKRAGHAVVHTVITRTDGGRHRLATWRIGSAYGAAFLSNVWYPDRLNTFASGMEQGSATIGLDLVTNLASEFWPDVKRKLFRRR